MIFAIMLFSITIGILILVSNPKTDWIRWLSYILFFAGIAAFANELKDLLIPFLKDNFHISDNIVKNILGVNAFLTQLSEHLIAYFFIMFSISYSGIFKARAKLIMGSSFFIVTVISFFYLPVMTNNERRINGTFCDYYRFLSFCFIPLIVFGVTIIYIASSVALKI